MRRFKTISILSFAFLFLLTSFCFSQSRARFTRPGVVDLTEEQLIKIQELRLAFQEELLPLRSQLQTGYLGLDLMEAKAEDQKKIDAKIAELTELEMELENRFLAHDQKIRELLTDEQKVLFDRWGGLGMGYGPGWGGGRGYGRGAAWDRGYGRGGAWDRGYGRGVRWDRGYGRGAGWARGAGRFCPMGRGWSGRAFYRNRGVRWQ